VREVCLAAYAHQDLPFERLVEELQPERNLSRTPLFQVMFILQNTPPLTIDLDDISLSTIESSMELSKFELTLVMGETAKGLSGVLSYSTDLFSAYTIDKMLTHFQSLLMAVVANPDEHIMDLQMISQAEQHKLLVEWNNTTAAYQSDQSIHQFFEAQATRTPSALAVKCGNQQLSYQELNARANQLAHYLIAQNVCAEKLVAICLERSIDMVVAMLGVLKTGAAYLPLDPAYPVERLAYMLSDSQATMIITQEKLYSLLPTQQVRVCLDKDWQQIAEYNSNNLNVLVSGDNAAYLIYTSGSTGRPKGVLGLHKGAINRFTWNWQRYPFNEGEVCCQKTAMSFADSIWEVFGPLLNGVPIVVIPDDVLHDTEQLVTQLAIEDVTRIVLVPSLLHILLERFSDLQARLPKLKIWVTSGEAISAELATRFQTIMPDSILLNLYGSSEVSADATYYQLDKEIVIDSRVPIGTPMANVQAFILDRLMQAVPIGVVAELYIGGDGLSRGYLNRPDITAEKFVPHP
ncbi:MAG: amino acid adenylation domain-containing protein, partial [Acidobacteriota bacterium]